MIQHPERLHDCDLRLIALVEHVGRQRDVLVIEGARTLEQEQQAIAGGFSALTNPMDSKHVIDPPERPLALAVDLGPVPLDWMDRAAFARLAVDVKAAAAELGIQIQWGGDWSHFKDLPHYELADA